MSFPIGGSTWTPETASQHAADMLVTLNALLQAQGLPTIAATQANAFWLFLLAVGSKEQTQDEALSEAINSFNLDLCSDQQIQNLLPIAGTSLIPGAYSSITMAVVAGSGSATVPSGASLPYGTVNFTTVSGISVPAFGIGYVDAICDTFGPVAVPPSGLNAFASSIPNLISTYNPAAAIVGRYQETPAQARLRLINGQTIGWNLNGVQQALGAIPGVTQAVVYFNADTTNSLVLTGPVTIPPRHARIIIAGTDTSGTLIASEYLSRITAPTDGAHSETYTFLSGQVFTVNYDTAVTQGFYVRVYYDSLQPTQSGYASAISQILSALTFRIGQTISSAIILDALDGFPYASIIGATVSLDGLSYSNKILINANAVPSMGTLTVIAG